MDFRSLWAGRERTTVLERDVVRRALDGCEGRRVLEVGPGGGRITPVLRGRFPEYVGVDLTTSFLRALVRAGPSGPRYVAGDVQRLPFRDGAFDAVSMVRVYNFLVRPLDALRELHRVLVPGGSLVMSYHHVPSLGTLRDDVVNSLKDPRPPGFHPVTFPPRELLQPRRGRLRALLGRAGFRVGREFATGAEDFFWGRWVPIRSLAALSGLGGPFGVLPHRFVLAKTATPDARPAGAES
jgi:SAM-dependent methyltransferase